MFNFHFLCIFPFAANHRGKKAACQLLLQQTGKRIGGKRYYEKLTSIIGQAIA